MKTKKHIYKKLIFASIAFLLFSSGVFFVFSSAQAAYTYTPMEKIPGFESVATDFPTYILSITKFAIWTVGIAALLMIIIGGFMYITSAGNTSRMDSAKRVIYDSFYGLIVALAAWLLLYVINPDLVKVSISLKAVVTSKTSTTSKPPTQSPNSSGVGECTPLSSGPCSADNLKNSCFGENAEKASAICNAESGGSSSISSNVDKCQPGGEAVSWGLFQINISANKIGGFNCPATTGAFDKVYTGSNHQCTVTNNSLYQDCVNAAKNSSKNIETACQLSNNGNKWSAWGANRKCKF